MRRHVGIAAVLGAWLFGSIAHAEGWKAGTARVAITPKGPIWMAGYAARTKPSEGAAHDLWAKALAVTDPEGRKAVIVTLDLCGIDKATSDRIRDGLKERHGLGREGVVLACSHTHSGPVFGSNLATMYPLDDAMRLAIADYTTVTVAAVGRIVDEALGKQAPASLDWETGRCDFAVNRRTNDQPRAAALRSDIALKGPVDHDVPVLRVRDAQGKPIAVVFGYACHCTTLSDNVLNGDYAGYAQIDIEKRLPGMQAMFVTGCGADQNPLPRGTVAMAEQYGRELADSVLRVLGGNMRPIEGGLAASYEEVPLGLAKIPDRPYWEKDAKSTNRAIAGRANALLKTLDEQGSIPTTYPYPVQVWRLGKELRWVFLGGEVVVDYALRIKGNLGTSRTWVSAYCNDVMAYIPSLRVLREGGYEGAEAMVYYGLPTSWSDRVEDQVIGAVRSGVQAVDR